MTGVPGARRRRDLLFRFGFLCAPADASLSEETLAKLMRAWSRLDVGGLAIYAHPETTVTQRSGSGGSAVLIGEAFAASGSVDSALDDLMAAVDDDGFFEAFDTLSGRFALLVLTERVQRVLHDPIGSRSVYYRAGGDVALGSHAELVARACGHPVSAEAEWIIASEEYRSRSVKYLPGDLTLYRGVHGLAPNNYYDLRRGRPVRYWPRRPREAGGFDAFANALDQHLEALAAHLRAHAPILGVSGGIDTRTLIAAFRRHALPFRGATWLRPGRGADERERELIERQVAEVGFEHAFLDLGEMNARLSRIARLARRNAGGFGQASRTTAHMRERFAGSGAVFIRGYGAEIVRGFYNLRSGFSLAARARTPAARLRARLARHLGGRGTRPVAVERPAPRDLQIAYDSSMRLPAPRPEHTERVLTAFGGFAERAAFDDALSRFGFDLSDLFYWEHRMGMWGSAKHNEMDPAVLSIAGFNSRAVYEAAFALDRPERLTKALLLRVIERSDPALAAIPYL